MPILTPKQTALKVKGFITKHRQILDTQQFQESLGIAEAEYVHRLCERAPSDISSSSSEQAAAACFQRILGMHEFIIVLKNLSETPQAPKARVSDNLEQTK